MLRKSLSPQSYTTQKGSALVIAIFVVLVMSLLGFTMVKLLATSADNVIHEVYGVRALSAAQSGINESLSLAFPIEGPAAAPSSCVNFNRDYSATNGLQNCSVSVSCSVVNIASENIDYYRFVSNGSCATDQQIVSRTVAIDAKVEL